MCAATAGTAYCQDNSDAGPAEAAASQTSVGLKDAYAGKFLIGAAGDIPRRYSEAELANIKANYNVITPENSMKPQPTHPSEDSYNFTTPDALVEWCEENNIKVWGHTLCWHSQTGRWFRADDGLEVVRGIRGYLLEHPEELDDVAEIGAALGALEAMLDAARIAGVRFRLSLDY